MKIFGYFDDWIMWFQGLPLWVQVLSMIIIVIIALWIIINFRGHKPL